MRVLHVNMLCIYVKINKFNQILILKGQLLLSVKVLLLEIP